MSVSTLKGTILTPEGWMRGSVMFSRTISRISGVAIDQQSVFDGDVQRIILPGFIDLHVHGGGRQG